MLDESGQIVGIGGDEKAALVRRAASATTASTADASEPWRNDAAARACGSGKCPSRSTCLMVWFSVESGLLGQRVNLRLWGAFWR